LRTNDIRGYSDNFAPNTSGSISTPGTSGTIDSDDTPMHKVGGIIRSIGRKAPKRKAKAVAEDLMVEVMTKELFILG